MLDLLELELQMVVRCSFWVLGTKLGFSGRVKLGPLQGQQVLLTAEPSLQPHIYGFYGALESALST